MKENISKPIHVHIRRTVEKIEQLNNFIEFHRKYTKKKIHDSCDIRAKYNYLSFLLKKDPLYVQLEFDDFNISSSKNNNKYTIDTHVFVYLLVSDNDYSSNIIKNIISQATPDIRLSDDCGHIMLDFGDYNYNAKTSDMYYAKIHNNYSSVDYCDYIDTEFCARCINHDIPVNLQFNGNLINIGYLYFIDNQFHKIAYILDDETIYRCGEDPSKVIASPEFSYDPILRKPFIKEFIVC